MGKPGVIGRVGFYLLCSALSCLVLVISLRNPGTGWYERSTVTGMVYGAAYKPFVYRALVPGIVRAVVVSVPEGARGSINKNMGFMNHISRVRIDPDFFLEYFVASVMMCISIVGFFISFRYLAGAFYGLDKKVLDFATVYSLLALPLFFKYYTYIYDFSTLFLFTLSLALMAHEKFRAYLFVFTLACINKETAALLPLVYYMNFKGSEDKKSFRLLLAAQAFIFLCIKLSLWQAFRDNPGAALEFHLLDHNVNLVLPPYNISLAIVLLAISFLAFLIFKEWPQKPVFLRNALWIMVPLLCLTILFGYLDEVRDYYEAYPIILLLSLPTACRLLHVPVLPAPAKGTL